MKPTQFYHDGMDHANAVCKKCFWSESELKQERSRFMRESKTTFDGDISIYRTDETEMPHGELQVKCGYCGRKSFDYPAQD